MTKINDPKLHRHGDALIRMEQRGGDVHVRVRGHKDDLLHLLLAVLKRKNNRLCNLIERAVLMVVRHEAGKESDESTGERSIN